MATSITSASLNLGGTSKKVRVNNARPLFSRLNLKKEGENSKGIIDSAFLGVLEASEELKKDHVGILPNDIIKDYCVCHDLYREKPQTYIIMPEAEMGRHKKRVSVSRIMRGKRYHYLSVILGNLREIEKC